MDKARVWIARDKDGSLYLFATEPKMTKNMFIVDDITECMEINKNSHPEITWGNSPQLIEV